MSDETNSIVIVAAVVAALLAALLALFLVVVLALLIFASPQPAAVVVQITPSPTPPPVLTHTSPPNAAHYQWVLIDDNFDNPIYLADRGDKDLIIVEQLGLVFVVKNGLALDKPFLDVSDLLPAAVFQGGYSEQGLLGLAFMPGRKDVFFISYTNRSGDSVLARYRVLPDNPDRADPASATILLTVKQPFPDHNGGNIAFGPDGFLYMGLGDGGNIHEPNTRSLDPTLLLGKMLRLDVSGDQYTIPLYNPFYSGQGGYKPEIWASGLRNPWRFSFDRATGDLYIGDVGQANWEEIDFQPANSLGGENYGWSAYEGTHRYLQDVQVDNVTLPITEYPHEEGCSVTGGYVYRGAALPDLQGYYFLGDYCNGFVWTLYRDAAGAWHRDVFMDTDYVISSFGQDANGELYLVDYKGGIYRLEGK